MPTIQEALVAAVGLHQSNRLHEAAALYRRILEVDPQQPDARHLLGVVVRRQGDSAAAAGLIRGGIAASPMMVAAYINLGNAYGDLGRRDAAVASFERARLLQPANLEAVKGLAGALRGAGRPAEAAERFREAIALRRDDADSHNGLGNALCDCERTGEAAAAYRRALALNPASVDALCNLGVALRRQEALEAAAGMPRRALALAPENASAWTNLGTALLDLGRNAASERALRSALALEPGNAGHLNNLSIALRAQGRLADSIPPTRRGLALTPDLPDLHRNLGMVLLTLGRFAEGWPEYEWRWNCRDAPVRPAFRKPAWNGGSLEGRTLLVYNEQGLGDTLQFARYAPLARRRGGRVILTCQPPLLRLLRTLQGVDEIIPAGPLSESRFDTHAPLLGLPGLLGTTLDTVPADVPYLSPEPDLVERHRGRLPPPAAGGLRIGINWQGNPKPGVDLGRSFPLSHFVPLARIPGIQLVSLQKNHGVEQLADLPPDVRVTTLGDDFDGGADAFIDTAAVMASLDLIITSDTAMAHLAGALGRPVWVALKHVPEWRFLLHREDSPWYPTMRLFRQDRPDDWSGVFAKIAAALELLVRS